MPWPTALTPLLPRTARPFPGPALLWRTGALLGEGVRTLGQTMGANCRIFVFLVSIRTSRGWRDCWCIWLARIAEEGGYYL